MVVKLTVRLINNKGNYQKALTISNLIWKLKDGECTEFREAIWMGFKQNFWNLFAYCRVYIDKWKKVSSI